MAAAFAFSQPVRLALFARGLSTAEVAALESLEEEARRQARALRVPSASAMLRAQARRLEKLERRMRRRV